MKTKDDPALLVAGAELLLEGLSALKKISRSEERGFYAEPPYCEPSPEEFRSRHRQVN